MRTALTLALLLLVSSTFAQAEIKFEKRTQKFEKVKAGESLSFDFLFFNTGTEPLIVSEVKVSCGCTKPEFSKAPVLPGESATIHVRFDTKGKIGYQDRVLEVYSNAKNNPAKIRFKGMVDHKSK